MAFKLPGLLPWLCVARKKGIYRAFMKVCEEYVKSSNH